MSSEAIAIGIDSLRHGVDLADSGGFRSDVAARFFWDYFADKDIDPEAAVIATQLGFGTDAVNYFLLGNGDTSGVRTPKMRESLGGLQSTARAAALDYQGYRGGGRSKLGRGYESYAGLDIENHQVISLNTRSQLQGSMRDYRSNGAARYQTTAPFCRLNSRLMVNGDVATVPIGILGAGAAGVIAARTLVDIGFINVTVFDPSGKVGGIWQRPDIRGGSKNNPFPFLFNDAYAGAVDRNDYIGSGKDILTYIREVTGGGIAAKRSFAIEKARATQVEPGDLRHQVTLSKDGSVTHRTFPILIDARGTQKPLPPSHPGHMETPLKENQVGRRWQEQLTDKELESLEGQHVVFIGLGNSTMEVVLQIQDYERRTGRTINYTILTHLPQENILSPEMTIHGKRLARDTKLPELAKLAMDLPHINNAYIKALHGNKIQSGIVGWSTNGNTIVAQHSSGTTITVNCDRLYTLIGYGQRPKTNDAMGLLTQDVYTGGIYYDWDAEVQRNPEELNRRRLSPGHFAIGPVLKNSVNPNALVIPGIQWQVQHMVPTIVFRAAEYVLHHRRAERSIR